MYSAFGKYSDPLTFSTFCYSLNIKCINRFSSLINKKNTTEKWHLNKYSDPLFSTLLKHLWQRLQPRVFLGMTLQDWHTCIWEVSPIRLCGSSQALVRLNGKSCYTDIFRSLQRCSIKFKSGLWLGPSRTLRLVLKPLLHSLGCVPPPCFIVGMVLGFLQT